MNRANPIKKIKTISSYKMGIVWLICLVGVLPDDGYAQISSNQTLTPLSWQGSVSQAPVQDLITLPAMGDTKAMSRAAVSAAEAVPSPLKFAEGYFTDIDIKSSPDWNLIDHNGQEMAVWRQRVSSPDGLSLNFGFSEYYMPAGGQMFVYDENNQQLLGPYTSEDNEIHGELWTPLIESNVAFIEVNVPRAKKPNMRLVLSQVSQGFLDFKNVATLKSGSCNVDVVCSEGDAWRDQIRSVGRYTIDGDKICSGAAIHTTDSSRRRFFLTAAHCNINAGNAASVVVQWKYENSVCRIPGSLASGQNGDGSLDIYNTGAIWRSTFETSDMTLLELDDPFVSGSEVFLAGWDRRNLAPSSAVAIHHPNLDEKRISFENDATSITNYGSSVVIGSGTHIRVADWDLGTTESGSSGSPLFDQNKRIVGQLHGGLAACGNDFDDWYGRISVSWNGGGTDSSRLRNWLDPLGVGSQFIDGIDYNAPIPGPPASSNGISLPWIIDLILEE